MAQAFRNPKKHGSSKSNPPPKGKTASFGATSRNENSSVPRNKPNMQSFEVDSAKKRSSYFTEPIEYQGNNYEYPDRSEEPFSKDAGQTDQIYHRYDQGSSFHHGPHTGKGPKNFQRSDERIQEDICEMLTRHPSIDAKNIEVQVKKGEVTLSGTVPERYMKYYAEDGAANSLGVVDVINNIRLKKEEEKDLSKTASPRESNIPIEEGPLSS